MKRFFSGDRMGTTVGAASNADVFSQIDTLASNSAFSIPEIDLMAWSFGAKGYGEICGKTPNCTACPFYQANGGTCAHP